MIRRGRLAAAHGTLAPRLEHERSHVAIRGGGAHAIAHKLRLGHLRLVASARFRQTANDAERMIPTNGDPLAVLFGDLADGAVRQR